VKENWMRLACDVTHYEGRKYLTIVDSGPSRFAVWKWISDESAQTVTSNFETVFLEFGPPEELLLDNSATFKSELLTAMCQRWNVRIRYRAAYRASGNAIVERHHSTVKRMAARARMSVLEAAFYYNFLPRDGQIADSCPYRKIYRHRWRCPLQPRKPERTTSSWRTNLQTGDSVLVKPPGARCTTQWRIGTVTCITPEGAVEVDGVHRHVGDIRELPTLENHEENERGSGLSNGYSLRDRATLRPPRRYPE